MGDNTRISGGTSGLFVEEEEKDDDANISAMKEDYHVHFCSIPLPPD